MNVSFQVVDHFHEFLLANTKISQNPDTLISIFTYVPENCLRKILYHVFCLCLPFPKAWFHQHWTVLFIRNRAHIRVLHKSTFVWNMRNRITFCLDYFDIVSHVRTTSLNWRTRSTEILIVKLSITWYLSSLQRIINASWATNWTWEALVEFLVESILSLE